MRTLILASMLLLLSACGGGGDSTPDTGPVPIPDTELKGTVGGKAFTGKYAVAFKDAFDATATTRSIRVAANALDCSFNLDQEQYLLLEPEWAADTAYDFSLQHNLTFTYRVNGEIQNDVSLNGRVQVVTAPTAKDAKGRIRIRATTSTDSVEGAVDVLMCE